MFQCSRPIFAGGVVLKAKMLENISMYPKEMLDILYSRHSEGILSGVEIYVESKTVIRVTKGIIKFHGMLYHMDEDEKLEVRPEKETQYLKIRFKPKEILTDEEKLETECVIETRPADEENEFEICRFVLNEGAILRTDYADLKDYSTLHNTINIIETKYSAIHKSTFSPKFLLEWARKMNECNLSIAEDVVFAMECLKEENIKREIIESYISRKLHEQKISYSNQEIYTKLIEIYESAKRGETGGGMQGRMQMRRMLVD